MRFWQRGAQRTLMGTATSGSRRLGGWTGWNAAPAAEAGSSRLVSISPCRASAGRMCWVGSAWRLMKTCMSGGGGLHEGPARAGPDLQQGEAHADQHSGDEWSEDEPWE